MIVVRRHVATLDSNLIKSDLTSDLSTTAMSSPDNPHFTTQTGKYSSMNRHPPFTQHAFYSFQSSPAPPSVDQSSLYPTSFSQRPSIFYSQRLATTFSHHGSHFLSHSLHKASKANSAPKALFMTDGKPVDITLTLTGKGFESRS